VPCGTTDAVLGDMRCTHVLAALCIATPAAAAPDFVASDRAPHPYAASSARTPELPREDVVFVQDSAELTETGVHQIATAARWLAAHQTRIVVEGHADSAGDPAHNADLAEQRADSVRAELVKDGVAGDRIVIVSYGDVGAQRDVNPNDRRVVLYATTLAPDDIAQPSFQRGALAVSWTDRGSWFHAVFDSNVIASQRRTVTARR